MHTLTLSSPPWTFLLFRPFPFPAPLEISCLGESAVLLVSQAQDGRLNEWTRSRARWLSRRGRRRRRRLTPLPPPPPSRSKIRHGNYRGYHRDEQLVGDLWRLRARPLFLPFPPLFFLRCLCRTDPWISLRSLRPIVEGGPSGTSCFELSVARDVSAD